MPTAELPDIKDAGLVVDFVNWGNPFHGAIVNTTLNLDGGGTHVVPATTTNDCHLFRVPGAPGSSGDPAPLGGEWRDYLLLYGKGQAVYETTVTTSEVNWLFCRADGSRWMISITSAVSGIELVDSALSITFRAKRFGRIVPDGEVVPETVNFTLELASRGLGDTIPAEFFSQLPTSVSIGISHYTPTGKKCCLVFYATQDTATLGKQRLPYGFFEVVLNDSIFADSTATLMYSLADVLGTRVAGTYTYPDGIDMDCAAVHIFVNVVSAPSCSDAIVAVWYDGDGAPQRVTMDVTHHIESHDWVEVAYNNPWDPLIVPCPEFDYSAERHARNSYQIKWGAVNVATVEAVLYDYETGTLRNPLYHVDPDESYTRGWSGLETINGDVIWTDGEDYGPGGIGDAYDGTKWSVYSYHVNIFHPWAINYPGVAPTKYTYFLRLLSATLVALCRTYLDGSLWTTEVVKYITPNGLLPNPDFTIPPGTEWRDITGAWQPVTNAINIGHDGQYRSFV